MKLTHLFCDVDDFCRTFIVEWQKNQLIQGGKKRHRPHRMSYSEMITLSGLSSVRLSNLQIVLPEACTTLLAI
jgi:hypothetical protein